MKNSHDGLQCFSLSRKNAWGLFVCQCLNLSLLISELSVWMLVIISLCLCWRSLTLIKPTVKPHRYVVLLLACSGCIAIAVNGRELGVLLSMLHLLCFAYSLKSLELTTRKDFYQIILLGIFILASVLIFSQSLFMSLLVFGLLILNLTVLLAYFLPPGKYKQPFINSAKMVIQSIPLAVVLFIVFPRLSPFWQVPSAKSAQTGLSESVTPGDIAHLARSSALAFRVKFFTDIPQYNQLYWRAMVMDEFDGRTWQQNKNSLSTKIGKPDNVSVDILPLTGLPTRYQVMVEPSYQPWLFSLAVVDPKSLSSNQIDIRQLANFTIKKSKPVSQTTSYEVISYTQSFLNSPLGDSERAKNLQIPANSNPKLQAQAIKLNGAYPDEIERAQAVLDMIREQDFYYTLSPPLLSGDVLDQFFYQTKKGFCVHYASVFTFLMRASGVPARLVTGYLGGEYNKQSGHLSIYQYDAHAWAEIWVKDKGWVRVDPTAAVNPERVESGLSQILQQDAFFNNDLLNLHRYKHLALINTFRLQLDALDYQWTRLVLGYSSKRQYDLLTQWFGDLRAWKIGGAIGGSLFLVMIIMWITNIKRSKSKPLVQWLAQYQQILAILKTKGLEKPVAMPASQFSMLVTQQFPSLTVSFISYTRCFEALMYQVLTAKQKEEYLTDMNKYQQQIKVQLKKVQKNTEKGGN
jgi:transglutaminase-like putative cysteine protease